MAIEFAVITDTATLAVFDVQAIRHRVADTFDWWSIQSDEILEVNAGNIAFLNLSEDGKYEVNIVDQLEAPSGGVYLKVPTGRVFIGAGEDTSGGGLEPDDSDSVQGEFHDIEAGNYLMSYKIEGKAVFLAFSPSSKSTNVFTDSVRLVI